MIFRLKNALPGHLLAAYGIFSFPLVGWSDAPPQRMMGPMTCATSTCHGGVSGVGPVWHFSSRIWEADDRHADAGVVLQTPASRRIAARLNPAAQNSETAFVSLLQNKCISCHASVTREDIESPTNEMTDRLHGLLQAGVSCEACHGPASEWIDIHVLASFNGPQRFDQAAGMRNLESWHSRMEACMRCHVGSRSADGMIRDVNHDLIAAGHPALRFDPSWFSHWMPAHWDTTTDPTTSISQIRLFAAGRRQLLSAAATLSWERGHDYLTVGHDDVTMPELAEFDCQACHSRLSIAPTSLSRGEPDWNPWYVAGLSRKIGRADVLRLSTDTSDIRLAKRQRYLERLAEMAEQSAEKVYEQPAPTTLLAIIQGGPEVTNEYEAMIWYLGLSTAWQDPPIRDSVPNRRVEELEAHFLTISGDLLRVGSSGESLLNPNLDFRLDRFREQRRELIQLLDDAR